MSVVQMSHLGKKSRYSDSKDSKIFYHYKKCNLKLKNYNTLNKNHLLASPIVFHKIHN